MNGGQFAESRSNVPFSTSASNSLASMAAQALVQRVSPGDCQSIASSSGSGPATFGSPLLYKDTVTLSTMTRAVMFWPSPSRASAYFLMLGCEGFEGLSCASIGCSAYPVELLFGGNHGGCISSRYFKLLSTGNPCGESKTELEVP
jgi:hypothetical protein